jgi:heat shock protein HtpX
MGFRFRSTLTITSLYLLLFLLLSIAGWYFELSTYFVAFLALGFLFLQYLISPIILGWIFRIHWFRPEEIQQYYPHIYDFITRVAQSQDIKPPKFGIIHEGTPNAFTYGWTKNSANLVITDGILYYLNKEEQLAVVGHELGHIRNNDFIVMTLVSAIPVMFYIIFRTLIYARPRRDNDKAGAVLIVIAIASYIMYIIGSFLVLFISRIREYMADEASAEFTQNPNALSSSLVKIAYGLMDNPEVHNPKTERAQYVKALGIFDQKSAQSLVYATASKKIDNNTRIVKAAAWDLHNPWAKYFEIFSTHPLPAKRIKELSYQAYTKFNQKPAIDLGGTEEIVRQQAGKSYLMNEFLLDLLVQIGPKLIFFTWIIFAVVSWFAIPSVFSIPIFNNVLALAAFGFILAGVIQLIQNRFKYKQNFVVHNVEDLLSVVTVSPIRPVPTAVRGRIIGRGVPGLFWSEDVVIQDEKGDIIYIDYSFGIRFIDALFAIFKVQRMQGQLVDVVGWYRRGPSPYIQVHFIQMLTGQGNRYNNYQMHFWYIAAGLMIVLGVFLMYIALPLNIPVFNSTAF